MKIPYRPLATALETGLVPGRAAAQRHNHRMVRGPEIVVLRCARSGSGGLRARKMDPRRNSLHLVLALELHFFKFDFFQEIF